MALIEFQKLSKIYQIGSGEPLRALDEVDLRIDFGEYVSIVGPSGSGKSTLLQIIGLLDRQTSGTYKFMSEDTIGLNDDAVTSLRARSIGFIFQLFNLLPRVTVEENIVLPMIYRGVNGNPDWPLEVMKKVGLQTHRKHTPAQLSGGQQQRVAIGRALVNRPQIILADEPTGNLPQKQAHEIISELEKLNTEGMTLIVITHDQAIAERARRVIQMVDGKIVSDHRRDGVVRKVPEVLAKEAPSRLWNFRLWKETLKIALQSLGRNKIRTFLTTLGIIIGVFSVISMLAIGEGAKKDIEYTLRQMGSNMFRVASSKPSPKGAGIQKVKYRQLTWDDYEGLLKLQSQNSLIHNIAPALEGAATTTHAGRDWSTVIQGVDVSYEKMRNVTPVLGRFFSEGEAARQETVCILGNTVYHNLFEKNENPVGKIIQINLKSFRVLGILPTKGSSWGKDEDDVVIIPINTAIRKLFGSKYLTHIYVQAANESVLNRAIEAVSERLRVQHAIQGDEESDFVIKNFGEIKKTIEQVTGTMTKFIAIIALISLIVGGIGIMNIMLVSVTERTREIGVRKAIGAKRRDILFQFLIESMMIGLVGGVIGIALAAVAALVMTYAMDWEVSLKFIFVSLSFLFSLLIGIFFGLYPAYKASNLSPIHALRYE